MGPEKLVDRIYEAAALPQSWPDVLQGVAQSVGARGSLIFTGSMDGGRIIASPGAERLITDYVAEGWMENNPRATPLVEALHPGFQTDGEFFPPERKAVIPVYRDFLIPRGFAVGTGTVVQGVNDDALVMTVEGFASEGQARDAVATLDALRPHLARAMSLSARIALNRSAIVVEGLAAVGTAAAVIGPQGRLRAANEPFQARFSRIAYDRRSRLSFADAALDAQFERALAAHRLGATASQSVVVRGDEEGDGPCVVHVLPLAGRASDVFESDGLLLLVADGSNARIPNADLLRLLFDLTPAEARLTRLLVEGRTLTEAAGLLTVAASTARTQLKSVFLKTGINRQADLIRVLSSFAAPVL